MSVDEALRWLQMRAQRKCDYRTLSWSMTDVEAVQTILTALRDD
jgi:hypothetical protein